MAIAGIGVDRIRIARVEASLERFGERFVQRVYTEDEVAQARAEVRLLAGAKSAAERQGIARVFVSLSDDDGIAVAFAVAEVG